jgi:hypothetical protein
MRIRKLVLTVSAVLGLVSAQVPAGAGVLPEGPGPGGFSSDNLEWVTFMPLDTDSAGARLKGKYFYITSSNSLRIYDVSAPESPKLTGILPLPQQPQFAEEDVDTNGRILLASTLLDLYIIDVEDKANPQIIGTLAGADEHTYTCVLDCRYAYGSEGAIVDLRDPNNPKMVGDWGEGNPASSGHDVTEVRPGIVMTSSQPMMLLDARKSPAKPEVIGLGSNEDGRFIHSNLWPHGGKDRIMLVGGETLGPQCGEGDGGAFMTWDMTKVGKKRTFTMIDEYYVTNGLPTDGNAPANQYCTHWFEPHPTYRNGGLVAMGWYEHGTRLFNITSKGKIEEAGYHVPLAGSTSAAYWITDEIIYSVDYQRGLDILRFTGDPKKP